MTKENENLMIILDLIYQARKYTTYIFVDQQGIIISTKTMKQMHISSKFVSGILFYSSVVLALLHTNSQNTGSCSKGKKKLVIFFEWYMLLVAISICYCKRTMIIVDNIVNSVDLLNMQTYCQVTSKKKRQNILVVLILFCRKPTISHCGNNSSVNFKASCYAKKKKILLLYL